MHVSAFREWAKENNIRHGSALVECDDIAQAEAYVGDFPTCCHGFAVEARIDIPYTTPEGTKQLLRTTMRTSGYVWIQRCEEWQREGYRAQAAYHDAMRYASIYVSRTGVKIACSH